jgi:hypothetical protein
MHLLDRFRMAVLMLLRRRSETARLDNELQFHLDQQIQENMAKGLGPSEAREAALRAFGNPTLLRDQARSTWSWNWLEKFLRDLRYGARTLTRSPGFALTAILVMALGIGATTSLFTIVRSVLLKPLPFRDPDNLVMVYEHFRENTGGDGFNVVSPADFNDWHHKTHGFADMAAWHSISRAIMRSFQRLSRVREAPGTCSPFWVHRWRRDAPSGRRKIKLEATMWYCSRGAFSKGVSQETPLSSASK